MKSSYYNSIPCACRLLVGLNAVAIFMAYENGDNKGQRRDGASKACWLKRAFKSKDRYLMTRLTT